MPEYLKQGWPEKVERSTEVAETVSRILSDVEREGLPAVRHYSQQLDQWDPDSFVVPADQVAKAAAEVGDELAGHLEFTRSQVERFATEQRATMTDLEVETQPGVVLGHRHIPVASVGSYAPGGRYPLIASSIMTVTVPKVAGVDTLIAAAPPRDGNGIYGPQLYTMDLAGADAIVCLGGVQALAALAFGLEDLPGVDMVVGAGNAYVAEAKRQLFGTVGIDLLAGPTEVAVSDTYAPEHLELQTAADDWYAANLRNYGSLFIGPESTVAYSDKSIGTNHVLPTGRAGRYTGGLWVGKFLKTVTYQRLTADGGRRIAPSTAAIADAELMYGHALTARLRLESQG